MLSNRTLLRQYLRIPSFFQSHRKRPSPFHLRIFRSCKRHVPRRFSDHTLPQNIRNSPFPYRIQKPTAQNRLSCRRLLRRYCDTRNLASLPDTLSLYCSACLRVTFLLTASIRPPFVYCSFLSYAYPTYILEKIIVLGTITLSQ